MVIFIRCEMEDDGRRSSKKSGLFKWVTSRSRPSPPGPSRRRASARELFLPTERRPLRSVPLVGPYYRVEPEVLINEFVEKETKYLGTVSNLESHFDATDRSSLLKIVDEQQTLDLLPCQLSYENDIIISFSVHNIKLLRRDGEKMIHRIQTHKIAAVGYVRDDNQHLVFIKFASELNPKMCNLSILCCTTKTAAEEVCSLAQQVFQLVYTDSTIDFLDKSIMYGAITPKNDSYSTDDSDKKDTVTVTSRDYQPLSLKKSEESLILQTTSQNLNSVNKRLSTGPMSDIPAGSSATLPLLRQQRHHRRSGSSGSSSNNNIPPSASASTLTRISPSVSGQTAPVRGELQLHDYMTVLKEQLTNVELQEFAKLLKQFRTGGILIHEFSNQLLHLYTDERKHLLLGMRHFIPNKNDLSFFNKFLKNNNVKEISAGTISSWWAQAPRINPRTLSETEESNTSAAVGNVTAISLSSSGSERASASVVSNDDSGEWKDLFGNIEKFGIYPSTDSGSGGAELENSHKAVNGTPPNTFVMDAPVIEGQITKSYVPPVAEVPEGFQDSKDDTLTLTHEGSLQEKSSSQTLGTGFKIRTKDDMQKVTTEKRKSKSDTSTLQLTSEPPRPATQDSLPSMTSTSPDKGHRHIDSSPVNIGMSEKSQTSKPQKEHRKKKKHKKESGVVAMF